MFFVLVIIIPIYLLERKHFGAELIYFKDQRWAFVAKTHTFPDNIKQLQMYNVLQ